MAAASAFRPTILLVVLHYVPSRSPKDQPLSIDYRIAMSLPQDSAVVAAMGFTPLDLVDVHVGRTTVKLYPKISPSMQIWERAHAYQINKTALKNLPTNLKLIIDAFGAQLNASSTTEGIISDFKRHFSNHWMCFQNLTILSP